MDNLAIELIEKIYLHLSLVDRKSLSITCKKLHNIWQNDEFLWRQLQRRGYPEWFYHARDGSLFFNRDSYKYFEDIEDSRKPNPTQF